MTDVNDEKILVEKEVAELADHYITFILSLGFLKRQLDEGADLQKVCFEALRLTKQFVDLNHIAYATGASQPFALLAAGLNDVWAKKNPDIFKHNPALAHATKPGESFNAVKAAAAAVLELRFFYGADLEVTAREIARDLHKQGITHRGASTPVTWETVKGWRDEMGGRNHPMATSIYTAIIEQVKGHFGEKADLARVEKLTSNFLNAAEHSGAFPPAKSESKAAQSDF